MERAVYQSVEVGVARSNRRRRRRRRQVVDRLKLDGVVVVGRGEDVIVEIVVGAVHRRCGEALGEVSFSG